MSHGRLRVLFLLCGFQIGENDSAFLIAHPYLGLAVTGLCVVNVSIKSII